MPAKSTSTVQHPLVQPPEAQRSCIHEPRLHIGKITHTNMAHSSKPSSSLFDVYLRLRPSNVSERERFLDVEQADPPTHITIQPPVNDNRRRAVEKFAFTRVYEEDAGQLELFKTSGVISLLEGVLGQPGREGRDGLLATLGVTGSGKVRYTG